MYIGKKQHAFTVIELAVEIVILGILAVTVAPSYPSNPNDDTYSSIVDSK